MGLIIKTVIGFNDNLMGIKPLGKKGWRERSKANWKAKTLTNAKKVYKTLIEMGLEFTKKNYCMVRDKLGYARG